MPKIILGVPSASEVNIHTLRSLDALRRPEQFEYAKIYAAGAVIWSVRGSIVMDFLKSKDHHYLFFCDSDMVVPPNALTTMLSRDKDIVAGLCVKRYPMHEPVIFTGYDEAAGGPIYDKSFFPMSGLHPVWGSGLACSLIKRHVFEAILEKFGPHLFWHQVMPNGDVMGEDVTFYWKANQCGFKAWLDADVHVGHVTHWPVFPIDGFRLHSANMESARAIWERDEQIAKLKNPSGVIEVVQV